MILTQAIIEEAKSWLGCKETSNNRSVCIDKLQKLYDNKVNNDAWCAKFVWTITDVACKKLGINNPLYHTASTKTMLAQAKKNLRVDKTPAKGAVFFTTRTGGGHVGFVIDTTGSKFDTIEGNTNIGQGDGVWKSKRDTKTKQYQFIHLEDLDTINNNLTAPINLNLEYANPRTYIGASIIITGGILTWKLLK